MHKNKKQKLDDWKLDDDYYVNRFGIILDDCVFKDFSNVQESLFDKLPIELVDKIMKMCLKPYKQPSSPCKFFIIDTVIKLIKAYPCLEPHLANFMKCAIINDNSLKYLCNSYILNSVIITCASIDMHNFIALKNVKKLELFDFHLIPLESFGGTDSSDVISCEFMCEELIIENGHHVNYGGGLSTITYFVFKNFSKLKKYTHIEPQCDDMLIETFDDPLCLPALEMFHLSYYSIADSKFKERKNMRNIKFIFDEAYSFYSKKTSDYCFDSLQTIFQLNMPVFKELIIECRQHQDSFGFLTYNSPFRIESNAHLICENINLRNFNFNSEDGFRYVERLVHYSKECLETISVVIDVFDTDSDNVSEIEQQICTSIKTDLQQFSKLKILYLTLTPHSIYSKFKRVHKEIFL